MRVPASAGESANLWLFLASKSTSPPNASDKFYKLTTQYAVIILVSNFYDDMSRRFSSWVNIQTNPQISMDLY